ncbi:hypothetical protein JCM24511_01105 [Saitozyma sp. JCM 24511]|nr:hypothetical protein JCM24511_01105 [Saitozyma sp. JCM 24511]
MSQTVEIFVAAPLANGMVLGADDDDPTQFQHVAFQHPHGRTWFGGLVLAIWFHHGLGAYYYKILTSVRFLRTPNGRPNLFWDDYWERRRAGDDHLQAIAYAHAQVIADDR